MQNYELTLVLPEKATPAKKKSTTDLIEKLAKAYKGKIIKTDDWGKIELAYTIAKNNAGNFLHFRLELDSQGAEALKDKIRVDDSIIRSLMIKEGN
jgi:small subunit ribosomal protein S6